jgi:UDP-N-acetylmuramyl tripeptide synthase
LDLSSWQSPLPGLYNRYNTLAAVLTARECHITDDHITTALTGFAPAFGRQEEFAVADKKIKVFLSKNPAGFNASLRTVLESKPAAILFALNDRIPDGRDVSWIWDVDFETVPKNVEVVVTGDRVYDMAIRVQYSAGEMRKPHVEPDLRHAIKQGLQLTPQGGILYVLSTYSAMLEVRKIVGGRKIL